MKWSISNGTAGTIQTLKAIEQLGRVPLSNTLGLRPEQLDGWFRRHWLEVPDGDDETILTVADQMTVFQQTGFMIGDCDDVAVMALALSPYSPAFIIAIRWPHDEMFSHVFVEVLGQPTIAGPHISTGSLSRVDPIMEPGLDYSAAEKIQIFSPALSP